MFQPPAKFRGGNVASGSVFLSLSFPSTPAYVIPRELPSRRHRYFAL